MTEVQIATILFAAPFLLLSIMWAIGLALLEYQERAKLRALRKIVREGK